MHAMWLITLVFGAVSSMIAHAKGRNSLGWFLAGVFLGPFSLVIALLPPEEREGMYTRCPACREVIREDAVTCRYCRGAVGRV